MQNSEAVQAWFQGKMASFRILGLVSKNEIRSREFSFSSRSLRVKIINLDLVSMPEIGGNFFSVSSRSLRVSVRNSRSCLDERDWIGDTLILVSRLKKRLSLTTASNLALTSKYWPKFSFLTKPQLPNLQQIVANTILISNSYTSTSFELASSHARVTSIKFTKQEWVSEWVSQSVILTRVNNDRTRVR